MVQNWPFFKLFLFKQFRKGKCVLRYSRTKKRLSTLWKQRVQRVEKLEFFQRVKPWFWSRNSHFFNFFFLSNLGQENVFYDILEQKNAFLRYKNKKSKKPKTWHFSKGVKPWFLSKNGHFSNFFFLSNSGHENIFNDILKRKKAFLEYKKRSSKRRKLTFFPRG